MACSWDREANVAAAEALVREAAGQGAQVVLIQELFETPYFCCDQKESHFALAQPAEGNPLLARMAALAAELEVVLPVSFFERANYAHYNSLAMLDADGRTSASTASRTSPTARAIRKSTTSIQAPPAFA